jgi:23S rRNA (cytosine1962-C5)-methyltransferase
VFERALAPFRAERILCDDEDVLVVDKPWGLAVHGGDESFPDDLVRRLALLLSARGSDPYLGVHQRLDKGTSGVLLFTRRRELNARVATDFEKHTIERVYVAVVTLDARARLKERGRLEHQLLSAPGERTRVVPRGGQQAITEYRVTRRVRDRAWLELRPCTGRTHQLRVQLAHVGAPIAGDTSYGGAPAPRLLLHAKLLGVPSLARRFVAEPPRELDEWLADGRVQLGPGDGLAARLADAACRRHALNRETEAFRLSNGAGDLLPGVTIDCYGEHAVLALSSEDAVARGAEVAEQLLALGARGVYLKNHVRSDLRRVAPDELAPVAPLAGDPAPDELVVTEQGARFGVRLNDGLSTGLFIDQRDNRARIRALARDRRVLNLFCYTGSFSVAAALGGARETLSIDLSARALARARENFALNGLSGSHRFLKEDALAWLERARRKQPRFDLIVLDPPSFATIGKGETFSVSRGYGRLAENALALLAPGGTLLAVTNHRKTTEAALRRTLAAAAQAADRTVTALKSLPAGRDCPSGEHGAEPSKSVLVSVA